MPHIEIQGLKKYYEIHGQGESILLLHHGFGCTKMWEDIFPLLVAGGYRVVMYDRRGYGRSAGGKDFFSFYVSDEFREEGVKELEALRQALDLDGFHAVGQCEGGVVAVDYALAHPERVKSVVTSSTQCFSRVGMRQFNRDKFRKSFSELEDELREKLIDWHGPDHVEAFYEQFREVGGSYGTGNFDLRPVLAMVRCPSLVLYPDRSLLFEVEQGVEFYRNLQMGELQVLPRCGHNTYDHRPKEYAQAVIDFLKRVEGGKNDMAALMATCVAPRPARV